MVPVVHPAEDIGQYFGQRNAGWSLESRPYFDVKPLQPFRVPAACSLLY
jgi:hypothetical protein